MPTRDAAPLGAPCWIDLMTSDADQSRKFYGPLFGWAPGAPNEDLGGYFNFTKDGVVVAGCIGRRTGSSVPPAWSVYLASEDANQTVDNVVFNGGQILVAATEVAKLGTMGYVTDPGGAGIGIWQPGLHQGFGVLGEPGTPMWFELHTRDYDEVVTFYRTAFDWDTHAMSDTENQEVLIVTGMSGAGRSTVGNALEAEEAVPTVPTEEAPPAPKAAAAPTPAPTPLPAGDVVYVVSKDGIVVCAAFDTRSTRSEAAASSFRKCGRMSAAMTRVRLTGA